jgi:hypothetical protein
LPKRRKTIKINQNFDCFFLFFFFWKKPARRGLDPDEHAFFSKRKKTKKKTKWFACKPHQQARGRPKIAEEKVCCYNSKATVYFLPKS